MMPFCVFKKSSYDCIQNYDVIYQWFQNMSLMLSP